MGFGSLRRVRSITFESFVVAGGNQLYVADSDFLEPNASNCERKSRVLSILCIKQKVTAEIKHATQKTI